MTFAKNKIESTSDSSQPDHATSTAVNRKQFINATDQSSLPENDSEVMAILSLLSENADGDKELRPVLKRGYGGIVYDLGNRFEVAYEKLRQSEKKGLLTTSGHLAFSSCPKCEDLDLQTQLFCPECSSQALVKSDLLIHYDCQSTGPVEEFQSNIRNGYYCQKCRKELKRVGIDYGNPGIGFKCSSCEKVFQFPLVLGQCSSGHNSKIDELLLKSFPKYTLGSNAKGLSPLLIESRTLKAELEKKNVQAKMLATLKGASGASHVVPLLLTLPPSVTPEMDDKVAIEFIADESNFEKSVLQLLLKSADLDKIRMIIVYRGSSGSIEHIRSIVNPKKVKVLLAAGDSGQLPELIVKEVTTW